MILFVSKRVMLPKTRHLRYLAELIVCSDLASNDRGHCKRKYTIILKLEIRDLVNAEYVNYK